MSEPRNNPGYVDQSYLDTLAQELTASKQRSYELMQVEPGQRVLDVGCGAGADTIPLARIVGSQGTVVGVDYDPEMIAEADKRAAEAGVSGWVTHKQGDATALPSDNDIFDSCRSERVFQHLLNWDAALSEMVRVTKQGGWIVVYDADWSSVSIDTKEVDIEWKLRRFLAERYRNGYVGRSIYGGFSKHKLEEIAIELVDWYTTDYALGDTVLGVARIANEAYESGVITKNERDRYLKDLKQAGEEGRFFVYGIDLIVAGRKPGA